MTRLPSRPNLDWKDDGTPVATAFDDVYFSRSDGLEETRAVFFRACGLPERWRDHKSFTIAELGFGTGLNFLALVDLWLGSERRSDGWLDFLTVEKHPMAADDARRSLARWPELKTYADQLLASWP
ncbi:MAG TPA: FAD-dependent cmnm(5)s(2)U34 oxidoreductase, partial [Hyphomonadaceae bacterium]|nr:FAD-dependent cmnm(5)s(2)U34 oxidoreductase [Hyphomonadaceae bacterium]